MRITSNITCGRRSVLCKSPIQGRLYVWVQEGERSAGREIYLHVADAVFLAEHNEFFGVQLFTDRIHFIRMGGEYDETQPVIRINDIDVLDQVNRAIAAMQLFSDCGDTHSENSQKVESVAA